MSISAAALPSGLTLLPAHRGFGFGFRTAPRAPQTPAEGCPPPAYEALRRVVHEAQLEPVLVPEALGQGAPHVVRGQGLLPAVLELREHHLRTRSASVSSAPATLSPPRGPRNRQARRMTPALLQP